MTKKLNIFLIIATIFSLGCAVLLIISTANTRYLMVVMSRMKEVTRDWILQKYYLHFSATLISALFCVCVAALLIYLLYRINKTGLLSATEDINAYRERKAAERNARRKAKAEKKKAAIERELAALNTPEENEFSEK